MRRLDPAWFSRRDTVRLLGPEDRETVLDLYRSNPLFFRMGNTEPSMEHVDRDMTLLPPGVEGERKYFAGFWQGDTLAAVVDLIDGYPTAETAYIGLFMVRGSLSGQGRGSKIVSELAQALGKRGIAVLRLAYDPENPQASHFWQKNGFQTICEAEHPDWGHLNVAEYRLDKG